MIERTRLVRRLDILLFFSRNLSFMSFHFSVGRMEPKALKLGIFIIPIGTFLANIGYVTYQKVFSK